MSDPVRPLVIVDRYPLPAVTGGRQRMWNFLLAVDALGPADLVVLDRPDDVAMGLVRGALPAWTLQCVPVAKRKMSTPAKFVAALRHRNPTALDRIDLDAAVAALRSIAAGRSTVVAIQATAAAVAERLKSTNTHVLVDLWDIEDARLARIVSSRPGGSARLAPLRLWSDLRDRMDIRAWRQFHRSLVGWADAVTVCSDIDRQTLPPSTHVHVVPNGAELRPLVHRSLHNPPTILYDGQLTYSPNADAAQILVEEILPVVHRHRPDVRTRIVGRADDRVLALDAPPLVTVTGFVEDIDVELAAADVLVVPLRIGGGTRLKILEAFSASLAVVSTAVGAEGLDADNNVHLMVADRTDEMAAAILRLLDDEALRTRLTTAAHALVEERFDWTVVRRDLTKLLRRPSSVPENRKPA